MNKVAYLTGYMRVVKSALFGLGKEKEPEPISTTEQTLDDGTMITHRKYDPENAPMMDMGGPAPKPGKINLNDLITEEWGVESGDIKPESRFIEDLGADELDAVQLIMALEEAGQIQIDDESAAELATVQQMRDYLKGRGVKVAYAVGFAKAIKQAQYRSVYSSGQDRYSGQYMASVKLPGGSVVQLPIAQAMQIYPKYVSAQDKAKYVKMVNDYKQQQAAAQQQKQQQSQQQQQPQPQPQPQGAGAGATAGTAQPAPAAGAGATAGDNTAAVSNAAQSIPQGNVAGVATNVANTATQPAQTNTPNVGTFDQQMQAYKDRVSRGELTTMEQQRQQRKTDYSQTLRKP